MGRIFVVSGPSGVGKNELIKRLGMDDLGLVYIPSFTTRKPRDNESYGNPYYFVNEDLFFRKKENGDFIEIEKIHGNWYGTDKNMYQDVLSKGGKVIKDIDVNGALKFKDLFGVYATLIFVKPPSFKELERRLMYRGGIDDEEKKLRLSRAKMEDELSVYFDHIIVNDDMDDTVNKLRDIIMNNGYVYVDPRKLKFTQSIRNLNMQKLDEISDSIKVKGYDENYPLDIVKGIDGQCYVSDGHHKTLASIRNGIFKVPALVSKVKWQPFDGIDVLQYDYEDLIESLSK